MIRNNRGNGCREIKPSECRTRARIAINKRVCVLGLTAKGIGTRRVPQLCAFAPRLQPGTGRGGERALGPPGCVRLTGNYQLPFGRAVESVFALPAVSCPAARCPAASPGARGFGAALLSKPRAHEPQEGFQGLQMQITHMLIAAENGHG